MAKRKIVSKRFKQKMLREKVRQEMMWLKKAGLTLDNIGAIYNITKQRVSFILKGYQR